MDEATKYTAAAVIHTKRKSVVVEKIFQIWFAYFGAPKKMHLVIVEVNSQMKL